MKIISISEISEKEEFIRKSHDIIQTYTKSHDLLQRQGVEKLRQPQKRKTTSKNEDDLKK